MIINLNQYNKSRKEIQETKAMTSRTKENIERVRNYALEAKTYSMIVVLVLNNKPITTLHPALNYQS